jgi:hypothetical protein
LPILAIGSRGWGSLGLEPCQLVIDRLVGGDIGVADAGVEALQVVLKQPDFEFDF